LGYYSRARNLHRCAQIVVAEHGGEFPRTVHELAALPGIGRSTAGAIAAFCYGVRAPILDANVRRVLTRALGFGADLAEARNERALWSLAEALLPDTDLASTMPRYTQGLMDLGAGICLPRSPCCMLCPLQPVCVAGRAGDAERYPVRTRKLKRRAEAWWLLLRQDGAGRLWLERRAPVGIWAGLYCPPVYASRRDLEEALMPEVLPEVQDLPAFTHVLTHRDLHLHPVLVRGGAAGLAGHCRDTSAADWFAPGQWQALGLPAPVRKLLAAL
ncbi:MAG: A/G-specific adenine glycosylase, partial [Alicycliphilus sp.]|nr:A/G-specific adenine glycosylase [Alicycliphilus sp.]